jgi:hypothetical protein
MDIKFQDLPKKVSSKESGPDAGDRACAFNAVRKLETLCVMPFSVAMMV